METIFSRWSGARRLSDRRGRILQSRVGSGKTGWIRRVGRLTRLFFARRVRGSQPAPHNLLRRQAEDGAGWPVELSFYFYNQFFLLFSIFFIFLNIFDRPAHLSIYCFLLLFSFLKVF